MKRINFMIAIMLCSGFALFSQTNNFETAVSIDATGAAPNASAMLDVAANDKGILIPRMNSAARTSIVTPPTGLMVYDSTLNAICHYNGAIWHCLVADCETLDEAYDCGGAGSGSTIDVDSGPVTLAGTDPATSTLVVNANSTGTNTTLIQTGMGSTLSASQSNPMAATPTVIASNGGTGNVLALNQTNAMAGQTAVLVNNAGIGEAMILNSTEPLNAANGASINHSGMGTGTRINTTNAMNPSNTLDVIQDGIGNAAFFNVSDNMNMLKTVDAHHQGLGKVAHFEAHNVTSVSDVATATHNGLGNGFHGTATDPANYTVAGVKGTGKGSRINAAALDIHDGQIRVTKTVSANTPAERVLVPLPSWLPMEDCPGSTGPGGDMIAWNSDIIMINNVYADAARSVILLTTEHPIYGLNVQLIARGNGFFTVQFVFTVDSTNGLCIPPTQCWLHYLIVNT